MKKKWAEEEEREARGVNYADDEEDEFDDEDDYEEEDLFEEDGPEPDLFSTKELPKIDMSAVMEIEEEAAKEKQKKNPRKKAPQPWRRKRNRLLQIRRPK